MYILGISEEHDAGAGFIHKGRVLSAVNEERLNREKFYIGFPEKSIAEVLKLSGVSPSQISAVALASTIHVPSSWGADLETANFGRSTAKLLDSCGVSKYIFGSRLGCEIGKNIYSLANLKRIHRIRKRLKKLGIDAPIFIIDHHYAHACSAYFTSGWDECLVITLDAAGDGYCSKVYLGKNGRLKQIGKIPFFHSPGYYYTAVTSLLGFKAGREGKVTGLAARGDFQKSVSVFEKIIVFNRDKRSFLNKGGLLSNQLIFLRNNFNGAKREDIAAGIQRHLENLVCEYAKNIFYAHKIKNVKLALAGGVFANVRLNQKLSELDEVKDVFIYPHMGDGGLAVGSALAFQTHPLFIKNSSDTPRPIALDSIYLGSRYPDNEIEDVLTSSGLKFKKSNNIEVEIAELLAQGKIVARFNGAMEYGPRALGNRSVLYQATDESVNEWLNEHLGRSEFMPFAPVILEGFEKKYFMHVDSKISSLPYMTIACNVSDEYKRIAPAVVHIDGTTRPQIISRKANDSYFRILKAYYNRTGLHTLLNTSFNMHEEPIVASPDDAVSAFRRGKLDVLAIGPFIVKKETNETLTNRFLHGVFR